MTDLDDFDPRDPKEPRTAPVPEHRQCRVNGFAVPTEWTRAGYVAHLPCGISGPVKALARYGWNVSLPTAPPQEFSNPELRAADAEWKAEIAALPKPKPRPKTDAGIRWGREPRKASEPKPLSRVDRIVDTWGDE